MARSRIRAHRGSQVLLYAACLVALGACGPDSSEETAELDLGHTDTASRPEPAERPSPVHVEGDAPEQPDAEAPAAGDDAKEEAEASSGRSPENLAAAVIATFEEAYEGLVEVLEPKPSAEAVRKAWAPIREKAETSMRELARHRSRLGEEDRDELDRLVMARRPKAVEPHQPTVSRAIERLHEDDLALAKDLAAAYELVLIALRDPPEDG